MVKGCASEFALELSRLIRMARGCDEVEETQRQLRASRRALIHMDVDRRY
jgi:hypothetical protein